MIKMVIQCCLNYDFLPPSSSPFNYKLELMTSLYIKYHLPHPLLPGFSTRRQLRPFSRSQYVSSRSLSCSPSAPKKECTATHVFLKVDAAGGIFARFYAYTRMPNYVNSFE